MGIRVSYESARGCGFRKEGGLYLVAPKPGEACELLPLLVEACPCCGQGIKPARGWTWINPGKLYPPVEHGSPTHNGRCPLAPDADGKHRCGEKAGLIWVGEAFYETPAEFMTEARKMGVSRRITQVPRGFKVGTTWVFLGHRKGAPAGYVDRADEAGTEYATLNEIVEAGVPSERIVEHWRPGVITVFRPTAIEYVVRPEDESDDEFLASLEKRGISPVKVIPVADQEEMPV